MADQRRPIHSSRTQFFSRTKQSQKSAPYAFTNRLIEAYICQNFGVLATQRAWAEVTNRQTNRQTTVTPRAAHTCRGLIKVTLCIEWRYFKGTVTTKHYSIYHCLPLQYQKGFLIQNNFPSIVEQPYRLTYMCSCEISNKFLYVGWSYDI